jgi:hypothetical protein
VNSKIPQKKKSTAQDGVKGSIAQTPCFADTPNTTNQFNGYKIEEKSEN